MCATMIVFYGAVAQRRREVGVLIAVGLSALVGVLGGMAPAIRAARMHPVTAIRA